MGEGAAPTRIEPAGRREVVNARSHAARRADEVFAARAARIAAREAAIELVLVDYFVAIGTAEQTLVTARAAANRS